MGDSSLLLESPHIEEEEKNKSAYNHIYAVHYEASYCAWPGAYNIMR